MKIKMNKYGEYEVVVGGKVVFTGSKTACICFYAAAAIELNRGAQ